MHNAVAVKYVSLISVAYWVRCPHGNFITWHPHKVLLNLGVIYLRDSKICERNFPLHMIYFLLTQAIISPMFKSNKTSKRKNSDWWPDWRIWLRHRRFDSRRDKNLYGLQIIVLALRVCPCDINACIYVLLTQNIPIL